MKYIRGYLPQASGRSYRGYNVIEDNEVVGRVSVALEGGSRSKYSINYRNNDDESSSFEGTLYKRYKKSKKSGRNYVSHYDIRLLYINHDYIGNDEEYDEKYVFSSKDQWGGILDAIDFAQDYIPQKKSKGKKSKKPFQIPIIGGLIALASAWYFKNK